MSDPVFARVRLVEKMHLRGENAVGLGVEMDARPGDPEAAGATPMELLLQAMGGCTSMDVLHILRVRRIVIDQYEVLIEGVKQDQHPKMYRQITLTFRARGERLTLPELEKAVGLSMEKYCSVSIALKETADISWRCELIEELSN